MQSKNRISSMLVVSTILLLLCKMMAMTYAQNADTSRNVSSTSVRSSSRNVTILRKTHLREVFDLTGTGVPFVFAAQSSSTTTPAPVIISKQRTSTFRPTSSILYLTPPKPRHIASIHSELRSIELDRTSALTLRWDVIVFLKPNLTSTIQARSSSRHARQIGTLGNATEENFSNVEKLSDNNTSSTTSVATTKTTTTTTTTTTSTITSVSTPISEIARVEEERNPLKWNIYIRRYGQSKREKFPIIDRENSLDPPYTGNKSYTHRLDNLVTDSSYELCIQSINGGRMHESDQIREHFPINAQTEIAGRNNPLFICKEVLIKPPSKVPDDEVDPSEIEFINRKFPQGAESKIRGRLADGSQAADGTTRIEVSEDATDAFVVYTAISSGSTTVLILIVVALFCCCKCNQRKNMHKEYRQYNRAPSNESPYFHR